jgi:hypothetical protein
VILAGDEHHPSSSAADRETGDDWSASKNSRRVELIDRHIEGSISPAERIELEFLQQQFRTFRQKHSALPIEQARQFHQELLTKIRN